MGKKADQEAQDSNRGDINENNDNVITIKKLSRDERLKIKKAIKKKNLKKNNKKNEDDDRSKILNYINEEY